MHVQQQMHLAMNNCYLSDKYIWLLRNIYGIRWKWHKSFVHCLFRSVSRLHRSTNKSILTLCSTDSCFIVVFMTISIDSRSFSAQIYLNEKSMLCQFTDKTIINQRTNNAKKQSGDKEKMQLECAAKGWFLLGKQFGQHDIIANEI